ncbi:MULTISPECIES: phosphoketolase [Dermacoccus]|uniref:phosphoketolase family protein n=1 Tax=Dermacoccus TaxID=57495 RepID=UPI0001E64081|nr:MULTISPECIES: phosphoketolase family protein [Dermacoccus]EFP59257.1 D-xylulose 5-phosphate/D-fructose 6-phosphate phosphoketolase [Dermacoccus sp. Ellin185]MCT1604795.1 phosphoketolase family protein [Dermacoccus nishinomiyaensis]TCJ92591.1 xylulose-5-phosphate/fructose-6-phosphate phosphoketolase [Dermacoccus sp. SAI-028]HCQ18679.1 phosphoketolase family protein [Dermacoccus sp.]
MTFHVSTATPWQPSPGTELTDATLETIHRWWRAANYLSVGQIYLLDNPLLREPLTRDNVKHRLLGHWGTTPGLNFLYAHLNRVIAERSQPTIYVTGPGHGGPGMVANTYLEGTYSQIYPNVGLDEAGLRRLVKQFSFPGGIPSHAAPETPGSIHEGGELGYALSHAYGAVFDNPELLAFTVIGDGEAETGPLATSWHSNKFVNPVTDGVVLPVLHLNGYKIANPTVLARISDEELDALMRGYGHTPYVFEAGFDDEDPISIHRRFATLLDEVFDHIARIKAEAAEAGAENAERPHWPMIVFRTPKGWTGPKTIDGKVAEGHWRSHQVPLANARDTDEHLHDLDAWLRSYRPDELFDEAGRPADDIMALAPDGELRMGATPYANGGELRIALELPDFRDFAVDAGRDDERGTSVAESTRVLGEWLRAVAAANPENFRIFGPDETASNRLQAVYETTNKQWMGAYEPNDAEDPMGRVGQVMEMLSEHQCQGWLEGYLLTGRHGLMSSYEAFIHIVDSMFNQHAKWLKVTNEIGWRRPISSLNYLLSSHVWRQDHNGFSHQDPGFIDHVVNKKSDVIRVYLPADANTLLSTFDHVLRTEQYVNVVVAGKQPNPVWLTMDEAVRHCARGLGIWEWAGTEVAGEEPDVVLACAGDIPTIEVLAAAKILRERVPGLKVRVVNVVDLMRLQAEKEHPHGLSDREFDTIFTPDKPIVFAYHGYPWLIHRLTYGRSGHSNLHVRGFIEEGTTTTPFDMVMRNDLDRFHLVIDVLDRVPGLGARCAGLRQEMQDLRLEARAYAYENGEDLPAVASWVWSDAGDTGTETGGPQQDTGGDNV